MLQNSAFSRGRIGQTGPFRDMATAVPDHGINMRNGRPVTPFKPRIVAELPSQIVAEPGLSTTASCLGFEGDAIRPRPARITFLDVQQAVCEVFKVGAVDLLSTSRLASIVRPRHIAIALARVLTGRSLPAIGRAFGNRDHTTVHYACNKHGALIATLTPSMADDATPLDWALAIKAAL